MMTIPTPAVFIADAHYRHERTELVSFINELIDNKEVKSIIFMGDIFDLLIPIFPYLCEYNHDLIESINKLSYLKNVIYCEGNHDFLLKKLFSHVKIIPLNEQPFQLMLGNHHLLIAHGDYLGSWSYRFYTACIRHPMTLKMLHLVTANGINQWFLKRVLRYLSSKRLCHQWEDFANYIASRLADVNRVEGHFHQHVTLRNTSFFYLSLPSFACNQEYYYVTDDFLCKKYKKMS